MEINTARISLRDAHLEMAADIDLSPLFAHLQSSAPTNRAALSTLDDHELNALLARANEMLKAETRIEVDGQRLSVDLRQGFDAAEMQTFLHASSATQHEHPKLFPVVWEAKDRLVSAKQIKVVFPAALGPVLITFVQPSTRYTAPGASAVFSVLEMKAHGNGASELPKRSGWAVGAVLLAAVAIALNLRLLWQNRRNGISVAQKSEPPPVVN